MSREHSNKGDNRKKQDGLRSDKEEVKKNNDTEVIRGGKGEKMI